MRALAVSLLAVAVMVVPAGVEARGSTISVPAGVDAVCTYQHQPARGPIRTMTMRDCWWHLHAVGSVRWDRVAITVRVAGPAVVVGEMSCSRGGGGTSTRHARRGSSWSVSCILPGSRRLSSSLVGGWLRVEPTVPGVREVTS